MSPMTARLTGAVPKLASLDIARSLAFFKRLGFSKATAYPGYGIVARDGVELHFWLCDDVKIAQATGCRINVTGIDELYAQYQAQNVIHPNDPLSTKPWGMREFSILDVDGNLITFAQDVD